MMGKKIIVFCPAYYASGGPELLHQLCFTLLNMGYDACMYYYEYDAKSKRSPVCENYKHYGTPYTVTYKDDANNICIVPEAWTKAFYSIKKGKKVLWWLSVDNFVGQFKKITQNTNCCSEGMNLKFRWKVARHKIYDVRENSISYHLVQSQYAAAYCDSLGIPKSKVLFLSDYLNDSYIEKAQKNCSVQKNNYILYNPKKGVEFTNKLIKAASGLSWKPIVNMTYDEVVSLMQKSKVYTKDHCIDFKGASKLWPIQ